MFVFLNSPIVSKRLLATKTLLIPGKGYETFVKYCLKVRDMLENKNCKLFKSSWFRSVFEYDITLSIEIYSFGAAHSFV